MIFDVPFDFHPYYRKSFKMFTFCDVITKIHGYVIKKCYNFVRLILDATTEELGSKSGKMKNVRAKRGGVVIKNVQRSPNSAICVRTNGGY